MAIKTCICDHAFQDRLYGDKRRVANETGASAKNVGPGSTGHRCTVCNKTITTPKFLKVKRVAEATEPDKKKKKGR